MIHLARSTHSPSSSDHNSHLKFVLFCRILKGGDRWKDVRTPRVKIVITTDRDRGSWITTC